MGRVSLNINFLLQNIPKLNSTPIRSAFVVNMYLLLITNSSVELGTLNPAVPLYQHPVYSL